MQAREVKVARLKRQLGREANRSLAAKVAADVVQGQLQEQRSRVMDLVMLTKAMQVCNIFTISCCCFHGVLVHDCVRLLCTSQMVHSTGCLYFTQNLAGDGSLAGMDCCTIGWETLLDVPAC